MPTDPRPDFKIDWDPCAAEASCRGIQVDGMNCLVHAGQGGERFLADLDPGDDLDLRGTKIDSTMLARILLAVRRPGGKGSHLGRVIFDWVWFVDEIEFLDVRCDGSVGFDYAWFGGSIVVNIESADSISFGNAQFEDSVYSMSISASHVDISDARFAGAGVMDVVAETILISGCRFQDRFNLYLSGKVEASDLTFEAEGSIQGRRRQPDGPPAALQCLGGDIGNLILDNVDMRECSFASSYRLDQLRMDGLILFASPPKQWRYTRRRVLADEYRWRGWAERRGDGLSPARIAVTYRSLRKSFEDSKNEAGAGDFYYGEMEMRRHSEETSRSEKTILWFYWLFSGYGQRAARAVAALVVLVVTVATLLIVWGQPFGHAARIAVGAVVFRDDRTDLTEAGEWTVLTARFLGPVFLALAVLAIRARVKR
jgi:hypothetical protein